ncbi:Retrovirus-related Pol polyprotein from transposon TNT 1-94 [Gossypium australe]|uniref:Retrovirus-related Pol polyprotein from transposon TNT 1-94 n=1 Tax=Gossypium australe TaxID=47621 RepID=A0A5B6X185_9ROSI|nr:Retrovirus-related Pol polyprotein from transposon TNT 1-94 [Gossypium australe]
MKKKYQGFARARRQQLQPLCSGFETLRTKLGESVTDYFSRTMAIVNKMRIHGDKTNDVAVIEKILRSMTTKFNFVVCSIEEAHVIEELSIDELQSSLLIHEQKICQQEEEEHPLNASTDNHLTTRGGRGRGKECRVNLNNENGDRTNFAENEEVSLLMACHVKEETQKNLWYLDIGCSNHMSDDKSVFSVLDEFIRDNVKFGDDSKVSVMGKGEVTIQTKSNVVHTISNVLFAPDLKTNLLSIGQLQKKGYEISIKDGVCRIQDEKLGLIAQVDMTPNRMFPLYLHTVTNSCFSTRLEDESWLWHFRKTWVYLHEKSKALTAFKSFKALVEKEVGAPIKVLHSDRS